MYKNILVPVLLDAEHADHDNAFATARALADEGAAFTVLHVSEAVSGFVEAEIPHHVIEERRKKEAAAVADIAKALPQAEARLVVGHAGNTIVDFAKTNDIDCIGPVEVHLLLLLPLLIYRSLWRRGVFLLTIMIIHHH